ncbi:staphostatin A, partial [Staphylococcus aureus]|uniref:staphostatin A n=1 Tax=Staphylococcus aureus TaxID=1280 RepID=UPI0010E96CA3
GEWHPQDLNDSPLKFILSTSDDSDYICKYINTFIPNDNKILLTIMNTEALGTSPRMTFIKHKS